MGMIITDHHNNGQLLVFIECKLELIKARSFYNCSAAHTFNWNTIMITHSKILMLANLRHIKIIKTPLNAESTT